MRRGLLGPAAVNAFVIESGDAAERRLDCGTRAGPVIDQVDKALWKLVAERSLQLPGRIVVGIVAVPFELRVNDFGSLSASCIRLEVDAVCVCVSHPRRTAMTRLSHDGHGELLFEGNSAQRLDE